MFKTIGILARIEKDRVSESLVELATFLEEKGYNILVEKRIHEKCSDYIIASNISTLEEIEQKADIIFVIGGDGSVLDAGRKFVDTNIPIVGINRGELGFLADISPRKDEMEKEVQEILNGDFHIEERTMLSGSILNQDGEVLQQNIALNDIVLQAGQVTKMIEFDLYIDDKFICSQKADGLIVSTPTGSTAYALSAGGSIIHPSLNVFGIVPINPHKLSNRPIVVSGDSNIKILVSADRSEKHPYCTFDGQESYEVEEFAEIHIKKHTNKLKLAHLSKYNYHEVCREKLGWAS